MPFRLVAQVLHQLLAESDAGDGNARGGAGRDERDPGRHLLELSLESTLRLVGVERSRTACAIHVATLRAGPKRERCRRMDYGLNDP